MKALITHIYKWSNDPSVPFKEKYVKKAGCIILGGFSLKGGVGVSGAVVLIFSADRSLG